MTKRFTTSFKAKGPQKLLSPVTVGLLGMNKHYCVSWID